MKRILLGVGIVIALFFALVVHVAPASAGNAWSDNVALTVGGDNVTSAVLAIPKGANRVAMSIPTITSSTVGLSVSFDGIIYRNYYAEENGTNTVIWTTAAGTGNISVVVPGNIGFFRYMKVIFGSSQAASRQVRAIWLP